MSVLYRFKFVVLFTFSAIALVAQTNLSGIINNYSPITDLNQCEGTVQIADATGFQVGMPVLVIQMQGAVVNQTNSSAFGSLDSLNGAGWYERNEILAITGNQITLRYALLHPYRTNGKLQLVSIPTYQDAQVSGTLTAQSWNGDTGGVLVFQVENRLQVTGLITVNGQGFRGGQGSNSVTDTCSSVLFGGFFNEFVTNLDNWRGAQKGEGISPPIERKESGRGPLANGGGGGNDHKAGGGGGAHHSDGGFGGRLEAIGACQGTYPGIGGIGLIEDNTRLFLGGGGGGGHGNERQATDGGNGGGIIIIFANQITGNGFIQASGSAGGDTSDRDAAGGGGAGGSIVLLAGNIIGNLQIEARGGRGGNTNSSDARCFGTGGGGSGGRIYASTGTGFIAQVNGGEPGIVATSLGACVGSTNGGGRGLPGQTSILQRFPQNTLTTPQVGGVTIAACGSADASSVQFDLIYPNPASFQYNFQVNQNAPSASISTTDAFIPITGLSSGDAVTLYIKAIDASGCASPTDTLTCITNACEQDAFVANTNLDDTYCLDALPIVLSAEPSGGTFSGGGINQGVFDPNLAGEGQNQIIYAYSDSLNCQRLDTFNVQIIGIPIAPTVVCQETTENSITFGWNNTASNYRITVSINNITLPIPFIISNTNFTQNNLQPGDSVQIKVIALGINGCGDSQPATQLCVLQNCDANTASINAFPVSLCSDTTGIQLEGSPIGGFFTGEGIDSSGFFQPSLVSIPLDSSQKTILIAYTAPALANCPVTSDTISIKILKIPETAAISCDSVSTNSIRFIWSHPYLDTFNVAYSINGGTFNRLNNTTDTLLNLLNLNPNDRIEITVEAIGNNSCGNAATAIGNCLANPCTNQILEIIGLASEYCQNDTLVQLTAHPIGGIFLGDGIDSTGIFNPINANIGINLIIYQFTDSTGCFFTDTLTTTVAATLVEPQISCNSISSNTLTFTWSHPNALNYAYRYQINNNDTTTLLTTSDTSLTISNLQAQDVVQFFLTALSNTICSNSNTVSTTCQTLSCSDIPPTIVNLPNTFCSNDTATIVLEAIPSNGIFILNNSDTINSLTPSNLGVGLFNLEYMVTDTLGCLQSTFQSIEILAPPMLPIINCGDSTTQSVNFNWQNTLGQIYQYQISIENNIILSDTTSVGLVSFGGLNPGQSATITLSLLNGNPCTVTQSLRSCKAAICVETESAAIALDPSYCLDTIAFEITATPAGGTFSGAGISSQGIFDPSSVQTDTATIFYTYIDAIGCTQQDTVQTTILTAPQPPTITCGNSTSNSTQFNWSGNTTMYEISISQNGMPFSTPIITTNTQFIQNNLTPGQSTTISIRSLSNTGCGNSQPVQLTCSTLPCSETVLNIFPVDDICLGRNTSPIALQVTLPDSIVLNTTRWRGTGITDSIQGIFDPNNIDLVVGQNPIQFQGTDSLGCLYTASTSIQINQIPLISAGDDAVINCKDTLITLTGTADNITANTTYRWSSVQGNILTGENTLQPIVNQAGAYFLTVANGTCEATDLAIVLENRTQPTAEASINQNITCQGDTVTLTATTTLSEARTYTWEGANNFQSNDSIIRTNQAGQYRLVVTNLLNFCTSLPDTAIVTDNSTPLNPQIIANDDLLTCSQSILTLNGNSTGTNPQYQWSNSSQVLRPFANLSNLEVTVADTYILTVRDVNGCQASATFVVSENKALPIANAGEDQRLGCATTQATLNGNQSSIGQNIRYEWTGNTPIQNANAVQANVNAAGSYVLMVINTTNGCTATDTVTVIDEINNINSVSFVVESPLCEGDDNGFIRIDSVNGGQAPYQYALQDNRFTPQSQFNNLTPGLYNLFVRDRTGCEYQTEIQVRPPNPISINLGEDLEVKLGESLILSALITPSFNSILNITWVREDGEVLCTGCSELGVIPYRNVQISATIEDFNGCIAKDDITLYVNKDDLIYAPNAFSPNNDGNNDFFNLFGSEGVEVIQNLKIYYRWGELVYWQEVIDLKNPESGWDGTKNGKLLNPGVFIYTAEVILLDGSRARMAGEVNLLR